MKEKPEDSRIDETRPLIDLYNKIRACDQTIQLILNWMVKNKDVELENEN